MRQTTAITFAFCLFAGFAFAQSQANTGSIEGIVSDQSGQASAGASVQAVNTGTNFTRDLTTDQEGRFRALLMPLGSYRVVVKATNCSTLNRTGIDLAVGQSIQLNLTLGVATVEQTVDVTADAPVIETSRVEQSSYIDKNSMRALPNNGRNFLDFVTLTPGVAIVQGPDGNEISINGQKGINNNVSIDGADNNNPFFGEQRGGQRPPFTVNLDAVKQFQVVSDGGTLGGRIKKDKLFYFIAYDQQVFRQTKQNNPSRIDPRLVDLFATKFNDPNENGPISRTNDAQAALGKIDWSINNNNLFSIRYSYSNSRRDNGMFDVDPYARSSNGIERDFANTLSGSLNTTLSPTTLNELRFQFSREDRPRDLRQPAGAGPEPAVP